MPTSWAGLSWPAISIALSLGGESGGSTPVSRSRVWYSGLSTALWPPLLRRIHAMRFYALMQSTGLPRPAASQWARSRAKPGGSSNWRASFSMTLGR